MFRITRFVTLFTLVAFAAGCSSDDGGSGLEEGDLSTPEAEALVNALFSLTFTTGFEATTKGGQAAAMSPAEVPISLPTQSASFTGSCPLGGTVGVSADYSGTYDDQTFEFDISMNLTETHNGCVVQDVSSGRRFTIDGNPSLTTSLNMQYDPSGTYSLDGSYDGNLSWDTNGKRGSCRISATFSSSGNQSGSGSFTMSGTMCGIAVNFSGSI